MSIERALGIILFIVVILLLLHLAGHAMANEGWGEHRGWHHDNFGHELLERVLPREYGYPYPYQRQPVTICSNDYWGHRIECHTEYR